MSILRIQCHYTRLFLILLQSDLIVSDSEAFTNKDRNAFGYA
jgi:hypothetical protein